MKLKKFVSLVLASVMALALSVPAFATPSYSDALSSNTAYEGELKAPTIKISVPDSGKVILNPYKMTFTPAGGDETSDQIVSAPLYIASATDVALTVDATVTGTAPTGVTFATATTQGTKAVTTKSVFMFFEIKTATDGSTSPFTTASTYDSKSTSQILVSAKAASKKGVITLPATDGTNATYAAYRLTGDLASSPVEAWTDADAVTATVAFTFTPTVAAAGR